MRLLAQGRVFADFYQIVLADGPDAQLCDATDNWTEADREQGFSGNARHRMFSTVAHLHDHWVQLFMATDPSAAADGCDRVVRFDFHSTTGRAELRGVTSADPDMGTTIPPGHYNVHVCVSNPGIDPPNGPADEMLSDAMLRSRFDLERYAVVLVPVP